MKRILITVSLHFLLLVGINQVASAQNQFDDISPVVAKLLEGSAVPSMAVAVVIEEEIVAAGAAGVRKVGEKERVTIDDRYHIGSCTKSMTAVLAGRLFESGQIHWDTTLGSVFDDIKIHRDYEEVNLQQLLTNSGGLPKGIPSILWARLWLGRGSLTDQRKTLVRGMLKKAPAYPPGNGYQYSNSGFSIAGAMMEQLTGKSYEKLMRDEVFEPLALTTAGYGTPAKLGMVDQPYGHKMKEEQVMYVEPGPKSDNPAGIAPAGAVHLSVLDFARYAQFHLGRHGDDVLNAGTLKKLHTPVGDKKYAMGWNVTQRKWAHGLVWTHSGSNTMFYAVMWLAPKRDFAVVVMCNLGGGEAAKKVNDAAAYAVERYME